MAPLKLSTEPVADAAPPVLTYEDLIAAEDWPMIAALYAGAADAAGGDVRLGPANLGGGLYLSGLTREMLKPAPKTPADVGEARRLVVVVDYLPECDPATTIVFGFGEGQDAVWAKQIEGPAEDGVLACALIHRWLGTTPCLLPDAPLAAANDNDPAAPLAIDTVPLPPMAETPFEPEAAGGLLADIARWITATAIVPVPELSMVSALALLAGCTGSKVLTPTGCGVNLYLGTLMATASGKGHPPKAARTLAMAAGMDGAMSNGDPTSYAALERILRRNISTALVMDELGLTLQDVNGRNRTAVTASIRKFLLAVYDQANGAFDGRQYALEETKKSSEPLKGPALTILGMTTPETLYEGLSPTSIEDGFLNRLVWVEACRQGEVRLPDLRTPTAPPGDLVAALGTAVASLPKLKGNIAAVISKVRIPFEGGLGGPAHEAWNEIFLWQMAASEGDKQSADLIGRAAENTIRIATLRAISRCPSEPAVSVDDVAWGWAIVKTSIDTIRSGVARKLAQTPFERLCNLLREHIEAAGAKGIHHSVLLRRKGVGAEDDRAVDGALKRLAQMGDITSTGLVGARSRYTFARLKADPAKSGGSQGKAPKATSGR